MKELEDPNFNSLMHELTTNPALAEQTMATNPKLTTLVQNFCGLLGDHFTALGDKEETKVCISVDRMSQINGNPKKLGHHGQQVLIWSLTKDYFSNKEFLW